MASTSRGLMTMPSTPWTIAVSTSAVCFGVLSCPSLSMTVMLPSASASAFIWFIMWTKNGKFRPGDRFQDRQRLVGLRDRGTGKRQPEYAGKQCLCETSHVFSSHALFRGRRLLAGRR